MRLAAAVPFFATQAWPSASAFTGSAETSPHLRPVGSSLGPPRAIHVHSSGTKIKLRMAKGKKKAKPALTLIPTERSVNPESGDIRIDDASVLPPVPDRALIRCYYCEQAIAALGTVGEVVEAYHAGIVFEIVDYEELASSGDIDRALVPQEFTVEWYAENFPFGAFLPQVILAGEATDDDAPSTAKTCLRWENESWAHYNPSYKPERWSKGRTLIGTVAGSALPKYGQWIVDYCTNNSGYAAFEVWDRPYLESGVTRRFQSSTTCSTFTQGSMTELYNLGKEQRVVEKIDGVELDSSSANSKFMIMRSYAPLISRFEPTLVDLDDPRQAEETKEFYIELNRAVREVDGEGLTTSQFIRLLANKLETFYVYDTPKDEYYKVKLSPPYFALASLYQPTSLPWQRLDLNGDGNLQDPAGFASPDDKISFAEELGRAAGGVADLARRRLPPVLKKKLQKVVTTDALIGTGLIVGVGGLGILAAAPLAVPEMGDTSFVSGLAVGVVAGAVGSKLFL